jgi:hypothetical protein
MSFKNCMLRVPGSYNAKSNTDLEEVRIIQIRDGFFRPNIKPLLFDLYIYLHDLKLRKIQQHKEHQHTTNEFCKYWRKK